MEPGLADLDDAVAGDGGAADAVPADRSHLVPWLGRGRFRRCLPRLCRGDPAGQSLVGSLGVIDLVELIDLLLQLVKSPGEGLFVEPSEQGLVEAFVLTLGRRFVGLAGDCFDAEPGDIGDELSDSTAPRRVRAAPLSVSRRCGTP